METRKRCFLKPEVHRQWESGTAIHCVLALARFGEHGISLGTFCRIGVKWTMVNAMARKVLLLLAASIAFGIVSAFYLSMGAPRSSQEDPVPLLEQYLKATYARDYREVYRFISSQDQRLKDEKSYVRERGAFSGFTLEVARKLAGFIEARPVEKQINRHKAHVKLSAKLPNANAPELLGILLDWNEEKLNRLAPAEQKKIIEKVDRLYSEGKIPVIEGEQSFELVKEGGSWKVFLNWAAGVRVSFDTVVPSSLSLEAQPVQREVIVTTGEPFNVLFKVKNLSNREISARIAHHVEPKEMAEYLELIQCGLLLPTRLQPGKEEEYSSAYLLRGDLPEGVKEFKVTYEFKMEE